MAMDYKFEFDLEVKTLDYWLLTIYNTYHSLVGVVNIVFFASMIGLCYRFFNQAGDLLQLFMFLGLILIPVIHPLGVLFKSRAQVMMSPKGTRLQFGEKGIRVTLENKSETIWYNKVIAVTERCGMVIIFSDRNHGYILTGRVLGKQKKELLEFLKEKTTANSRKK